jgi:raffinose/stachyose/melibiose transport system permease protein
MRTVKKRGSLSRRGHYGNPIGLFLFLLPGVGLYTAVMVYPAVQSLIYSVIEWQGVRPVWRFGGFGYYARMLADPIVRIALTNNLRAIFLHLFAGLPLALLLAYGLTRKVRGALVFRFLYYFPNVATVTILALMWKFLFAQEYGFNAVLRLLGLGSLIRPWLSTDGIVQWTTNMPSTWQAVGFWAVIFVAAISGIAQELYEAARIDGANAWHEFLYIVLPSVRNVYLSAAVASINWALGTYIYQYIMTEGGPLHKSQTLTSYTVMRLYTTELIDWGYGSTLAVLQFVLGVVVSVVLWRLSRWRGETG